MKNIICRCGKFIRVDDWNYEYVNSLKPYCNGQSLFISVATPNGPQTLSLAGLLVLIPHGLQPDHINGNYHDNQEANIRPATRSQNNHNKQKTKRNTSGYKNVTFHAGANAWTWQLMVNRKVFNGKLYATPEEAARARDIKAIELLGEFAVLNFPRENYVE